MKISTPQLQQFLLCYTQISPQGVDLREARDVLRLKRWVRARRFCYSRGLNGNDQFRVLNWDLRRRIFSRMMGLVRRISFTCTCLEVDKHFCDTTEKVNAKIDEQLVSLIDGHRLDLGAFECVRIYYDCGQKQLTKFLLSFFEERSHIPVEYAQGATPWKHIFLQVADLVATLRFIELKMRAGLPMTKSEYRFFGGPRRFKHDVLRAIKDHWLL